MPTDPSPYTCPKSRDELLVLADAFAQRGTFIAGGQSLVPKLLANPPADIFLIDVGQVPELRAITHDGQTTYIGSAVTFTEVLASAVSARVPVLVEALKWVGTRTIRNRATIGGSLAWADPRGELLPALMVSGATIRTQRRGIPAGEFVAGPFRSVLEAGEVILGVEIPCTDSRSAFEELTDRSSAGKAIAAVALAVGPRDGVETIMVAVSGLADRAVATSWTEPDGSPTAATTRFAAWASTLVGSLPPLADDFHSLGYRQEMAGALFARAFERTRA